MTETVTSPYDVAEHLRTPEEMAMYLEACQGEADGDADFIAKARGDIARADWKGLLPNLTTTVTSDALSLCVCIVWPDGLASSCP